MNTEQPDNQNLWLELLTTAQQNEIVTKNDDQICITDEFTEFLRETGKQSKFSDDLIKMGERLESRTTLDKVTINNILLATLWIKKKGGDEDDAVHLGFFMNLMFKEQESPDLFYVC